MVRLPERTYRMLLADDDRGFRESLRLLFEPFFELLEAESGEQTIEIVEQHPIDILLIDMHMDVLTGIETVQRIRPIIAAAPCILVTADATDEMRLEADLHAVLSKPVERQELVATVSTALSDAYDDPGPFCL